ncbi:protein EARLY FLOWERING 3 isoform X1 [Nicotiana tabacum]|uniref:Protein EARLY FLOWERING 3 isoform X1 n=1 Tax=Nicotiana tabacum TaxID=4097 RepID=A0A1S4DK95_TOBAC|nr:PREDICTED: protein EARLY FLOWERING 3-like isoform X2 [Nicotiana tabacum]
MKRGKGEEKVMGPMFPRLHVNDTEKGGPRAPPRNKMALYEQLSIPSQRFNSGVLPLNPNNNTAKLPPPSSNQGSGHERVVYFPVQHPPSGHLADKPPGHSSDPNTLLEQFELNKRTEEDDFTVPVFVNSKPGHANGSHNLDMEKLSPSGPVFSGHPNKDLEGLTNLILRQQRDSQNEENPKCIPASREHRTTSNSPSKECRFDRQVGCTIIPEPVTGVNDGDSYPMKEFASEEQIITNNLINGMESQEDRTCKSIQTGIVDQGDDLSETSIVESMSGTDISPDDVVGIIGLKRFWKARREIVSQQRVFAIQVFELHRLIKVQKLIAESPNSMLEDAAYLGKPLKSSSGKRLPLECIIRESQSVPKRKNDSEKPNFRMECSAENTVGKASLSSVQNSSQLSSHRPFSGNPPPTPVTNDANTSPWCFQQPPGHQWLIPVMSPSEGLVYKPFPGPGFTSPINGGCGPPGSMGNFFPPAIGVPGPHPRYQGMGVPFAPPTGHGYFPHYSMPVMNPPISSSTVEESNQFTSPGFQRQLSGGVDNFNIQHQDSSNGPSEKNGNVPDVLRFQATRDNELQASTASSPSERAAVSNATQGRNMLSLFPTSPATDNPDHSARVIKVVPHNPRSATESAARIFQSIQEERKQHDTAFTRL